MKCLKSIFHCDAKTLGLDPRLDPNTKLLKTLKFSFTPTRNPNASQLDVRCVGSQIQNSGIGHVHFFKLFLLLINFTILIHSVLPGGLGGNDYDMDYIKMDKMSICETEGKV